MKMNTKKTKTMVTSRTTKKPALKITLGNKEVERVKNQFYLGHQLTEEEPSDSDITRIIEIARGTFSRMLGELKSRQM